MTTAEIAPAYPVDFSVDYPDRSLNRLTTGLRILWAIPILILLEAVSVGQFARHGGHDIVHGAGGLLVVGPALMILFRRQYPRWWLDWYFEVHRVGNRLVVY